MRRLLVLQKIYPKSLWPVSAPPSPSKFYVTALIILSDVLPVNRNRRCHYPTTIVRFLIIQMEYTHDILNSIADFRCRRGDHIIACNSRIMCFGSSAIRGFRSTLSSCNMDSSVVSHSSNPNNMTR